MDRSPRGNDIITLRFFDFRNSRKYQEFHQNPPTRKYDMFSCGIWSAFLPEIGKSQNSTRELNHFHFLAQVTKHYACAAHFR